MSTALAVKLTEETKARIKQLAAIKHRSAHWLMREAIETYLNIEEEKEALHAQAHKAWQDYQETGLHLTGEEVDAWMKKIIAGDKVDLPACHR